MIAIHRGNTSGYPQVARKNPMRLDRFDLNLLIVLDTLLEERNVTKASQRLHIGQSAASAALARLREYFGDELLVSVGRRLTLTPLAQSLVEPVRDTVLRTRAVLSLKPGFDPATAERRFSVCASDYVTTVMLAQAVVRIAEQAPRVAIDIRSPPKDVGAALERGHIDLLVLPEQYVAQIKHPQARLFEDTQVCMVWSGNTQVTENLSFEQYMNLGHVAVRFGDERSITFEDWFLPRHGRQRRIESSVDNFSTLPLLLIGTTRVATLHRRLAQHFARYLPLLLIDAPFEMPALAEVMAWPRHLDHDPAHLWLREMLASSAAELSVDDATDPDPGKRIPC
jgi:DNA-binding transcriptional LysR family regulator